MVKKERILEIINKLPDDTTWDDVMYTIYFHANLDKSMDDLKNGRYITLEEFEKESEALYENYLIKNGETRVN